MNDLGLNHEVRVIYMVSSTYEMQFHHIYWHHVAISLTFLYIDQQEISCLVFLQLILYNSSLETIVLNIKDCHFCCVVKMNRFVKGSTRANYSHPSLQYDSFILFQF